MSKTLIQNGWITTATDLFRGDILIEEGKIKEIGLNLNVEADLVVDATDRYVFPGGIDAHVHMDVLCADGSVSTGYDTDSIASAVGGTTTMLDYVLQEKGQTLGETVSNWSDKAQKGSAIDYGFHIIITNPNAESLAEIHEMVKQGVTSFKLFMANEIAMSDRDLYQFMVELKENGCTAAIHAENKEIIQYLQAEHAQKGELTPYFHAVSRPPQTEVEAIQRALVLAELTGCPTLIAHISTKEGLELVREAKAKGLQVYAETCPHYLLLNEEKYTDDFESAKYIISPPLRSQENVDGLWPGVVRNDADIISSDHNGFSYATHKQLGKDDFRKIPNGAPGIEQRFSLMYHFGKEHGMKPTRFVELVSTNPAKIFGLYPKKGTIAPGSDADLVIFDPKADFVISADTQYQKSDYTSYEQFRLQGKVETVLLHGKVIVKEGTFVGDLAEGQYLKRQKRN